MDKTVASLGVPVSVSSDSGPPFNSQDFGDLSKYLGFRHEQKTPLNPQANAEAEQFLRVLKKLYQISKLTGSNFKRFSKGFQTSLCLQNDTSLHHLSCSGRSDVFGSQVPRQASHWSNYS